VCVCVGVSQCVVYEKICHNLYLRSFCDDSGDPA
jgi:hypothetical protein